LHHTQKLKLKRMKCKTRNYKANREEHREKSPSQ
jgi:hypothetical protein